MLTMQLRSLLDVGFVCGHSAASSPTGVGATAYCPSMPSCGVRVGGMRADALSP
jgi:hypothetical protein